MKKRNLIILTSILLTIILSTSYAIFVVSTNEYKASELLVSSLLYGIQIDGKNENTITVSAGTTKKINVKITSLNEIDSRYSLDYKITKGDGKVYYLSTTTDTPTGEVNKYNNNTYTKTVTVVIEAQTEMTVEFTVSGGYLANSTVTPSASYKAVTDKGYEVTVNVTGGTVDSATKQVKENDGLTFTLKATTGYNLGKATVKDCDGTIENGVLTLKNVSKDQTCTVTIPINTYKVTVNVNNGKSEPASRNINYNSSGTFTITANDGYITNGATVDGGCTIKGDIVTASKVTKAMTCTVTLKVKTVQVKVTIVNGKIGNNTTETKTVNVGATASFTGITANSGYMLEQATYSGCEDSAISGDSISFANVKKDIACDITLSEKLCKAICDNKTIYGKTGTETGYSREYTCKNIGSSGWGYWEPLHVNDICSGEIGVANDINKKSCANNVPGFAKFVFDC